MFTDKVDLSLRRGSSEGCSVAVYGVQYWGSQSAPTHERLRVLFVDADGEIIEILITASDFEPTDDQMMGEHLILLARRSLISKTAPTPTIQWHPKLTLATASNVSSVWVSGWSAIRMLSSSPSK